MSKKTLTPLAGRDLLQDLALCEAATPGPWRMDSPCYATPSQVSRMLPHSHEVQRERIYTLDVRQGNTEESPLALELDYWQVIADAMFIREEHEGWPAAVRRDCCATLDL